MKRAIAGIFLALCAFSSSRAVIAQPRPDASYASTPSNLVEAMLDAGAVGAQDYVIDLGSGDGRVVIEAARQRGDAIALTLTRDVGGEKHADECSGRIAGDRVAGHVKTLGGERT